MRVIGPSADALLASSATDSGEVTSVGLAVASKPSATSCATLSFSNSADRSAISSLASAPSRRLIARPIPPYPITTVTFLRTSHSLTAVPGSLRSAPRRGTVYSIWNTRKTRVKPGSVISLVIRDECVDRLRRRHPPRRVPFPHLCCPCCIRRVASHRSGAPVPAAGHLDPDEIPRHP